MKKVILLAVVALVPFLASAEALDNVSGLLTEFGNLVNSAIPVLIAVAVLGFFWGLVKFIFAQSNEEKKADAKKVMVWSLIALVVMVSVWGLVAWVQDAAGIDEGDVVEVPLVEIP